MTDGFVLVDKPAGRTSHDVIDRLRRLLAMRRIGHAGTLDPMATGLLVVGLGRATRLLRFIQELPKEYRADIAFGTATDTGDAEGTIIDRAAVDFDEEALQRARDGFIGEIAQVPPPVSAIKRDGQRLHRLARRGVVVEVEPRSVVVHEIEVLAVDLPRVTLRVRCGKGTYIRVLADDIAKALGSRGHVTALRRTASGSLSVDDAWTIEALERATNPADFVLAPAAGLRDLEVVAVPAPQRASAIHGAPIEGVKTTTSRLVAAVDDGRLIGVYRVEGERLLPEVVLT